MRVIATRFFKIYLLNIAVKKKKKEEILFFFSLCPELIPVSLEKQKCFTDYIAQPD